MTATFRPDGELVVTAQFDDSGTLRRAEWPDGTKVSGIGSEWVYQGLKKGKARTVPHNSLRNCIQEASQSTGRSVDAYYQDIALARAEQFETVAEEKAVLRRKPKEDAQDAMAEEAVEAKGESLGAKADRIAKEQENPKKALAPKAPAKKPTKKGK